VDSFYVITTGEISVSKGGSEFVALGVGDCFGEMGYLARTKRTATVSAKGHVDLIKLNEAVVSRLSLNCQVRFLKVFLRTLIHRLSVTTEQASRVL
jgi:serine/threonine-protein kinase